MRLAKYLKYKRYFECVFWALLFLLAFLSEILITTIDVENRKLTTQFWEILCWQASSIVVLLALIPLLIKFDHYVPLRWTTLRWAPWAHLGFSIVFSIAHVSAMVLIRTFCYSLAGSSYDFGDLLTNFSYEYAKDFKTYFMILAVLYLYRHILFRLQGEASLLSPSPSSKPDASTLPRKLNQDTQTENKAEHAVLPQYEQRLLVKMLGKEFLIQVNEIEYIEAAGNYVNLHVGERAYPLRATMANILQRIDESVFKRIHRSYIVNLNCVKEIIPQDSGDALVNIQRQDSLDTNTGIPMSRRYRAALNIQ